MPVYYRRWFIKRIIKDNEKIKQASKGEQNNIGENISKLSKYEKMLGKKNS